MAGMANAAGTITELGSEHDFIVDAKVALLTRTVFFRGCEFVIALP